MMIPIQEDLFLMKATPSMKGTAGIYPEYEVEDPNVVNRLVSNLMYLFNIQSGDYLTFVLGHGECHTNKQAMQYWVYSQLSSNTDSDDVLSYLASQLTEQLMMDACQ